jgi:hypothetical protein
MAAAPVPRPQIPCPALTERPGPGERDREARKTGNSTLARTARTAPDRHTTRFSHLPPRFAPICGHDPGGKSRRSWSDGGRAGLRGRWDSARPGSAGETGRGETRRGETRRGETGRGETGRADRNQAGRAHQAGRRGTARDGTARGGAGWRGAARPRMGTNRRADRNHAGRRAPGWARRSVERTRRG